MNVRKWSLSQQLSLGAGVLITLVMMLLIITVGFQSRNVLIEQAEEAQDAEISMLATQLETEYSYIMNNTQMLAVVFKEFYPEPLSFEPSETIKIGEYDSPTVRHKGQVVNLNFDHVDKFAQMTGGNATVFIRYNDDFLRVTTSLKNGQGKRAVGTLLGQAHPGYKQLLNGQVYLGEAKLFGTDYMTKYSPVVDGSGKTVAILYVGFPISALLKQLRANMNKVRFGESGYASVVYSEPGKNYGKLIAHKLAEDKNLTDVYPLQDKSGLTELLQQPVGAFTFNDPANNNRQARVSFRRAANSPWTVFAVSYYNEYTQAVTPLIILLVVLAISAVAALVILLGYFLRHSLKPLREVTKLMERVGKGDLTYHFAEQSDPNSNNEVDRLKHSTSHMLLNFSEVIQKVRHSGDEITVASTQLFKSSADMSEMAALSNAATANVSVSITQMASSIEHVGHNVSRASEEATQTTNLAEEGTRVVSEVVRAIGHLKEEFEQATAAINSLQADSQAIDNVVEVINSVADQTNLLALNAAIEAARAGEQGRGFAVVADEVRQLASRVQDSTKEIQQVVEKLQANAKLAAARMEAGEKQVNGSVSSAAQAGEMLTKIRDAANKVKARMVEVSGSTAEQSNAAEQITISSQSLEQTSGKTAKEVGGTTEASNRMLQQAKTLQSQVSQFMIN